MSVRTQPGCSRTQAIPRGARSTDRLFTTMFTAAFELRYGYEPPEALSSIEPMRLVIVRMSLRSPFATFSTRASTTRAGPSAFTSSTFSQAA